MKEREGEPLVDLAKSLEVDKRVVTTAVQRLNAAYHTLTDGGDLVRRTGRTYTLTAAGIAIAEELSTAHQHLVDVITLSSSKHREAWVPVSSECIRYLSKLAPRLRSKDIILKPSPKRSVDLIASVTNRTRTSRRRAYALFATCVFADQISSHQVSNVVTIPPDDDLGRTDEAGIQRRKTTGEMIRIKDDPFRVVARKNRFGTDRSVDLAELWRMDLIVPDGGAVLDYLNLRAPGWAHNRAHIKATDLHSVFACATAGKDLVPDPVFIYHGPSETIRRTLPGFEVFDLADDAPVRAVTGFFRDREVIATLPDGKKVMWNEIWEAAADEWLVNRSNREHLYVSGSLA